MPSSSLSRFLLLVPFLFFTAATWFFIFLPFWQMIIGVYEGGEQVTLPLVTTVIFAPIAAIFGLLAMRGSDGPMRRNIKIGIAVALAPFPIFILLGLLFGLGQLMGIIDPN